jgi:hypothetical protein
MSTPPECSSPPTAAAPEPSWKSHPEIRRLRARLWLLGAASLLMALLFVISSLLQAQSNALLRARLSALEATLRAATMENQLRRRDSNPDHAVPSHSFTEPLHSKQADPALRETSPGEPASP